MDVGEDTVASANVQKTAGVQAGVLVFRSRAEDGRRQATPAAVRNLKVLAGYLQCDAQTVAACVVEQLSDGVPFLLWGHSASAVRHQASTLCEHVPLQSTLVTLYNNPPVPNPPPGPLFPSTVVALLGTAGALPAQVFPPPTFLGA